MLSQIGSYDPNKMLMTNPLIKELYPIRGDKVFISPKINFLTNNSDFRPPTATMGMQPGYGAMPPQPLPTANSRGNAGMAPMPGQPMTGQPMPGQPMAGQPLPGQPMPGHMPPPMGAPMGAPGPMQPPGQAPQGPPQFMPAQQPPMGAMPPPPQNYVGGPQVGPTPGMVVPLK